jgi:hypothetical protein
LSALKNLEKLSIAGGWMSSAAKAELAELLPHCQMENKTGCP